MPYEDANTKKKKLSHLTGRRQYAGVRLFFSLITLGTSRRLVVRHDNEQGGETASKSTGRRTNTAVYLLTTCTLRSSFNHEDKLDSGPV